MVKEISFTPCIGNIDTLSLRYPCLPVCICIENVKAMGKAIGMAKLAIKSEKHILS